MSDSIVYQFIRRGRVEPIDNLIVKPASLVTRNVGDNVTLQCEASVGVFKEPLSWLKDNKALSDDEYITMKITKGVKLITELHIRNSKLEDSGTYTCSAVKEVDGLETRKSIGLTVRKKPAVKLTTATFDNVIQLSCNATGNPPPAVAWQKKDSDGQFVPLPGKDGQWELVQKVPIFNRSLETPRENTAFSRVAMIVVIACSSFVILLLLFVIVVLYRRKKRYGGFFIFTLPPSPDYIMKLDPEQSLLEQTNKLPYDAQWEFPRERLSIVKPIGSGAFGQVFLAHATGIVAFDPRGSTNRKSGRRRSRFGSTSRPYYNDKRVTAVAVKSLKDSATEAEYRDLVSELKILIHIGEHKNIVNLLGACTKGRERDVWILIEYCPHGNLLDFLRKRREIFEAIMDHAH
ncbi:hypothetical protein OS493_037133 [Desmophyllum pertusum]|uniref:receptor protein-tyrosine kinase n=1 Tax=Desmophyllum pertusum TaxID=174260 RepID=A0A9X0D7J6_9CNID|nr:hypothetical protein OS493_037133 [Desmophyllum pertusum]